MFVGDCPDFFQEVRGLSTSGDRVFFLGMEQVVQLVDGWFLEIEVSEATQVLEKHLSFSLWIYGAIFLFWVV